MEKKTGKIVKNSLFLYIRMLLTTIISIYTSRIILDALGVNDFGVYNVVAGFVSLFSFLSTSMSLSVSRFLGVNLGKGDANLVRKVFGASLNIHICIAIIIFIIVECIGSFYIYNYLNINPGRLQSAYVVFQFSLIALVLTVIRAPYQASITINEDINIFAIINVIESIIKLGIVYLLYIINYDRLEFYGMMICVVTLLITLFYIVYAHIHYFWCIFMLYWDKIIYLEIIRYALINAFGNMINMMVIQGQNIILNFYFGPVVNAARGIAFQVDTAIRGLVSNIFTAVNPQLIKSYGENNLSYMKKLLQSGAVLSFSFLLSVSIPVILYIDFILRAWLIEVPKFTGDFIILLLVNSLIYANAQPIMQAIHTTSRIGQFNLYTGIVNCLNILIPLIIITENSKPQIIFVIYTIVNIVIIAVTLQQMKRVLSFDIKEYVRNVYFKEFIIFIMSLVAPAFFRYFSEVNVVNFLLCIFISLLSVSISTYCWGLTNESRKELKNVLFKVVKQLS